MNDIIKASNNHKRNVKAKDNEVFIKENKEIKKTCVLDLNYEDRKISDYLQELEQLKTKYDSLNLSLEQLLKYNGYIRTENTLITDISNMQVINHNKDYIALDINNDGYVTNGNIIKGKIIENIDIPDNYKNYCYKVVDNKLELDTEKLKNKLL